MKPKDMLTYRAPRSTMEAFPKSAEYGAAIERPVQQPAQANDIVVMWACVAAAFALVAMKFWGWL